MQTPLIDPAALRLYYLQQLGVAVYVTRTADGSHAEEDMVVPDHASDGVSDNVSDKEIPQLAPADPVAAPVRQRPRFDIDAEVPATSTASLTPAPTAALSVASDDTVGALAPFQLLFAVLDARLAVAIQIPALAKPRLADMEARLLQNLLRWLGVAAPGDAWLQFRWPLPGMNGGNAEMAAKSMAVFLQQATSAQPVAHLLLMGQGPALCMSAASTDTVLPMRPWATHGLAEMLAVPALKREVWQQLLPLHALL